MTKPALLLARPAWERLLDGALDERFELVRLWQDPDALLAERGDAIVAALTTRLDAALLDRLPNLRLVATPGTGYENIDVAAARARGITVANAGDAHSTEVADHAVALTLAAVHRLPELQAWMRAGHWTAESAVERRRGMSAQRFGIVGLGNIGAAVAERLAPFGGAIAWWSRRDKPAPWPRKESLLALAAWSTVLVVATRGDAAGLIDADTIAAVGPEGLLVNVSRGTVIDEDALIDALRSGRLGRAALDVFAEEPTPPERWRDVPNVLLTPHVAGTSYEAAARLREAAVQNLTSVLDGGPVVNELTA